MIRIKKIENEKADERMLKSLLACGLITVLFFLPSFAHAEDESLSAFQAKLLKDQIQFIRPDHAPDETYPMPSFTRGEIVMPFNPSKGKNATLIFRDLEIDKNGQGKTGMRTLSIRLKGSEDIEVYDKKNSLYGIKEIGTVDLAGDGLKDAFWVGEGMGDMRATYTLYVFDPRSGKILVMALDFDTTVANPKPVIERSENFKDTDVRREGEFLEKIKAEYSRPDLSKKRFPLWMTAQYNAYSGKAKMTEEEAITYTPPLSGKSKG